MIEQEEKKVEYIELIYDLIFVYIIGRNNHLLHVMKDGFIDPASFLTYVLTALIILQIWYYTTLFVNRYGENDKRMHVGIFVNMYLLYFMARGIRADWQGEFYTFNVAWLLILLNIALQYYLQLKQTERERPWETAQIRMNILTILVQSGIIVLSFPVFHLTGIPVSPVAMLFGIGMALAGSRVSRLMPVDFGHLTERVMLYVVFTFGEMIIGITDYFEGEINVNTVYFSLAAFLIVAGLFMSYGLLYDHMIDRESGTNGTAYMMIHVFLLLSLNHVTAALEFMREEAVNALPKNVFLIASFVLYYFCCCLVMRYNKPEYRPNRRFSLAMLGGMASFAVLMLLLYRNPTISIAITVAYIWLILVALRILYRRGGMKRGS